MKNFELKKVDYIIAIMFVAQVFIQPSAQAQASDGTEATEQKHYDSWCQAQDKQRTELPPSAFVKNYSWSASTRTHQIATTKTRSIAVSKPIQKPM